jgi:hypothetical protein
LYDSGYTVDSLDTLTVLDGQLLARYGIVIIKGGSLTSDEMSTLVNWIQSGGSALFLAELGVPARTEFNSILSILCGIEVNSDNVKDPNHKFPYGQQDGIRTSVIFEHPTTQNVSQLAFFTTDGLPSLKVTGDNAIIIVEGEQEAYSINYANNPPLAAAAECEAGRIVVVTGSNNRNSYTFGDLYMGLDDNESFLSNIIGWLSHQ